MNGPETGGSRRAECSLPRTLDYPCKTTKVVSTQIKQRGKESKGEWFLTAYS